MLTAATSSTFELGEKAAPPAEFRIFKAGINPSSKGDFLFDEAAATSVMAAFAKKGATLTMDYEHQALADPPVIARASCSSWVPEVRNGELWATQCHWTEDAHRMISAREYTRFSPAFLHDPKTMRVREILNVALTNLPALDGIAPLVAASATAPGEDHMKTMCCAKCTTALKAPTDDNDGDEMYCKTCSAASTTRASMLSLVGLKATQSDAEVAVELSAIQSFTGEVMTLTGKASRAEALGVIAAWKANAAEVTALRTAAAAAEEARIKSEFDAALNAAVTAGKLPPAEKESLIALTGKPTADSLAKLTAYLSTRGTVVNTQATSQAAGAGGLITEEDRRLHALMPNAYTLEQLQEFKLAQLNGANRQA